MGFKLGPELAAKCEAMADTKPAKHGRGEEAGTPPLPWSVSFTVPLKVVSRPNRRDHWAAVARRSASEAAAVIAAIHSAGVYAAGYSLPRPARVRIVSLYAGRPMDGDNLAGAFKSVRDALAGWLGVDDGAESVQWFVGQEKARRAACRIEIAGGLE